MNACAHWSNEFLKLNDVGQAVVSTRVGAGIDNNINKK